MKKRDILLAGGIVLVALVMVYLKLLVKIQVFGQSVLILTNGYL